MLCFRLGRKSFPGKSSFVPFSALLLLVRKNGIIRMETGSQTGGFMGTVTRKQVIIKNISRYLSWTFKYWTIVLLVLYGFNNFSYFPGQQVLYRIGTKTGTNRMKKPKKKRKHAPSFQLLFIHMDPSSPFLDFFSSCIASSSLRIPKLSIC